MLLFDYLEKLPWHLGALLCIFVFIAYTIAGLFLVRFFTNHQRLRAHHDVAGFIFANLGVLYSVLLGFTVVSVQERFDKVKETTQMEAAYISQLYQDAEVFPEKSKNEIRAAIKNYADSVIRKEWISPEKYKGNTSVHRHLKELWQAYYSLDPSNAKEQAWYAESISKLNLLINTRLMRLLGGEEYLSTEMWTILICIGVILLAFTWFFSVDSFFYHIMMASILASVTASLLFLIYSLDTAYSGTISISPEPMIQALNSFI